MRATTTQASPSLQFRVDFGSRSPLNPLPLRKVSPFVSQFTTAARPRDNLLLGNQYLTGELRARGVVPLTPAQVAANVTVTCL